MYKVFFLDGYEITGVLSVETKQSRELREFQSLGQGYFPIADSRDLKAWVIKCQQTDTELFAILDKMLDTKEESRLIVSSSTENFNEQCYLKSYNKSEQNAGVFEVTMNFVEYKPATYRTTGIPNIPRPGKVPPQPKTVVFDGKKKTPAKVAAHRAMTMADKSVKQNSLYISEFGEPDAKMKKEAVLTPLTTNVNMATSFTPVDSNGYYVDVSNGKSVRNAAMLQNNTVYKWVENEVNTVTEQVIKPMFSWLDPSNYRKK